MKLWLRQGHRLTLHEQYQVPRKAYNLPPPHHNSHGSDLTRRWPHRNTPTRIKNVKSTLTTHRNSIQPPNSGYKKESRCSYHNCYRIGAQTHCTMVLLKMAMQMRRKRHHYSLVDSQYETITRNWASWARAGQSEEPIEYAYHKLRCEKAPNQLLTRMMF